MAGARSNDGNGSLLIERVGVVPENIRAASHGGFASAAVQRNRPKPRLTGRSILGLKTKDAAVHKIAVLFEVRAESRRPVPRDLGDVQRREPPLLGKGPPRLEGLSSSDTHNVPDGPPT